MTETRDNAGVIAPPPLLALAAPVLGLFLDYVFPAYVLQVTLPYPGRVIVGYLVLAAGFALGYAGTRAFTRAKTRVEPWKPSTALVTDGVFKWLRNPMYVGVTIILVGFSLVAASDWTLVMTVGFCLVIHYGAILREERYLEAKFGDAYRDYKARVPRYGLPF